MTSSRFLIKIRSTNRILLLALFILSLLYLVLLLYSIPLIFYVENYYAIVQVGGYSLFAAYLLTLLAWILGSRSRGSRPQALSIILLIFTTMLCCLSANFAIHLPTTLDTAILQSETYYLTGELEAFDIYAHHHLYKCSNTHIKCERTPFSEGGGASFRPLSLMIDEAHNKDEVNVLYTFGDGTSQLIYTYGSPNRQYDEEPVQLGNHLYYLAFYHNPEPRSCTYMLFQCNLEQQDCVRLPIEHKGFGEFIEVEADKATEEIKVMFKSDLDIATMTYGDEVLIFIWGENPRCYAEGCEILEK